MQTKSVKELEIPALGLGTFQLRGETCADAVASALNMGYRHIDTAEMYDNEDAVGRGIRAAEVDREDIFLTTKVWHTHLSLDDVHAAVNRSLERLGTDYVDLLLVHWPTQDVPLEETLTAFQEARDAGKTRHIGVSNFTPRLLEKAVQIAPQLVCNQVEMHIYYRQQELVDYCREHDLVLTAYSPLARGKAVKDPVLAEIGEKHDATAAQVALAWLIDQAPVVPIPMAADPKLQAENLAAVDVDLDAADRDQIAGIVQQQKIVDPGFAPW